MNIFGIQTAVVQTSQPCTWLQGCQNVLSSRQIIINSTRLRNSHQGTNSWGSWHLATFWNLESRKWHFQGFSRGTYSRGPRMPCCFVRTRARLGTILSMSQAQTKRIIWTFHRSVNMRSMSIKTGKQMREVLHGHATGFCRTVSFKSENQSWPLMRSQWGLKRFYY